jgi:hypothetical protein
VSVDRATTSRCDRLSLGEEMKVSIAVLALVGICAGQTGPKFCNVRLTHSCINHPRG